MLTVAVGCAPDSGTAPVPPGADSSAAKRPNILVYIVDTLRADALGCYGNPVVQTPAVDRFAREGVLFEKVYAPSSWTRPSMASILTGISPLVHGARRRGDRLSDRISRVSDVLRGHGYTTGCITANPNMGSFFGFDQGFDDFVELYARREAGTVKTREISVSSAEITSLAREWIDRAAPPFFLMILTIDPHCPYVPPDRFDRYGGGYRGPADGGPRWIYRRDLGRADQERIRSLYHAEVSFNDDSFGRLLDHLREAKLFDRTITVFTSDHGEEFWEHNERGHGKALFEESVQVPLLVRDPAAASRASSRVTRVVQTLDIFPTLLHLVGIPVPQGLDGRPLFDPAAEESGPVFTSLNDRGRDEVAVTDYPWKLIWDLKTDRKLLFNLAESPGETVDLAGVQADRREELIGLLSDWMRSTSQRSETLHQGAGPEQVADDEVPQDVKDALESLGYISNGRS